MLGKSVKSSTTREVKNAIHAEGELSGLPKKPADPILCWISSNRDENPDNIRGNPDKIRIGQVPGQVGPNSNKLNREIQALYDVQASINGNPHVGIMRYGSYITL